ADERRRLVPPRRRRCDELLVRRVEIRRVEIDSIAPVSLDPDAAGGPPVLVQGEATRVGRETERQGCHGNRRHGWRLGYVRMWDHVAARELGELDAEERPARGVGDRWREVLLDDESGRPSRERVALRAEEGGSAALRQGGEHRGVELGGWRIERELHPVEA